MPLNKFAIVRYSIIDSLLTKYNYVKTSLIAEVCMNKTGFMVSRRTIQLDLEAMKYDDFLSFYSPIDYCRKRKAYYYTDPDYSITLIKITAFDIAVVEYLMVLCKDKIPQEYYIALTDLIKKLKLFSNNDSEVKLRHHSLYCK